VIGAAGDEGLEGGVVGGGEFVFGVGEEVGAWDFEGVGEEEFGVAAGDLRGGCGEGFAEGHSAEDRGFGRLEESPGLKPTFFIAANGGLKPTSNPASRVG